MFWGRGGRASSGPSEVKIRTWWMGVAAIAPQLLHDLASLTVFYVDYTYTMHLLRSSPAAVLTNVPPRSTTLRFRPAAWACRSVCAPLPGRLPGSARQETCALQRGPGFLLGFNLRNGGVSNTPLGPSGAHAAQTTGRTNRQKPSRQAAQMQLATTTWSQPWVKV